MRLLLLCLVCFVSSAFAENITGFWTLDQDALMQAAVAGQPSEVHDQIRHQMRTMVGNRTLLARADGTFTMTINPPGAQLSGRWLKGENGQHTLIADGKKKVILVEKDVLRLGKADLPLSFKRAKTVAPSKNWMKTFGGRWTAMGAEAGKMGGMQLVLGQGIIEQRAGQPGRQSLRTFTVVRETSDETTLKVHGTAGGAPQEVHLKIVNGRLHTSASNGIIFSR